MFYQVENLGSGVYRLWDVSHTACYLVEGAERALLLDTGVGVGDLRGAVEELTDKPVTVVLTHGHVDHACGAGAFNQVYLHPADLPLYGIHSQLEVRMGYVQGAVHQGGDAALIGKVMPEDYCTVRPAADFLPLKDGMVFDLGGEEAEVFSIVGHTQGSVAILLRRARMLLLGDSCNGFTFLFDSDCPSVAQYRKNLEVLQAATAGKYDRTLFSHGTGEGAVDMIERVMAVCDDILSGNTDDMPFRGFDGTPACIAKAMDFARFCRVDGGEGNVVYDPKKVQ